jgi:hypothetical protein
LQVRTQQDKVRTQQDIGVFTTFTAQPTAFIDVSPASGGIITLNVALVGTVENRPVTVSINLTASPLVNQPPIARASSSQGSIATACIATVILDASATTDPDGNLLSLRWFDEDGTFVGEGPYIEIPVRKTGVLLFRLLAEDDIGGASTAKTVVQVTACE